MDNGSFETCEFAWDGEDPLSEELEVASIFSDIVLKKQGNRRLLFFKNEPESISFISKLYFPLKISRQGNFSFVLGTSFFTRSIKDYKLDKEKIENSIDGLLKDGITDENLSRLNELLGGKGFFGKIIPGKTENHTEFQVKGAYPDKYPNTFLDEFNLMQNIYSNQKDGVVFQQSIPDHILENSAKKLKLKLDEIESDIHYIKEKKVIISNIVNILHKQKDEIDTHYRQLYAEVLEDCNKQDIDASTTAAEAISVIEKEFESNINMFAGYYPILRQGLVNPTEFGGWSGLASEVYRFQKSDRKHQVIAANLLSKIRTCKSIVKRLRPEQGQLHPQTASFVNQVYETADDAEKQLFKHLDYAKDTIKEIWSKEETVKKEWGTKIKEIEERVNDLLKQQNEILKQLDLILINKKSTIEEIKANIALPVNSLSDKIYIPFWVACLAKQGENRFLVYGPMKKKGSKGLMGALQGHTAPLERYSKGIEKLRSEIETRLNQDKKLAGEIIIEGGKFNKLNARYLEFVSKGLEILKLEGWIKNRQMDHIVESMSLIETSPS